MSDYIIGFLLLSGGVLCCAAGLGILRFPDVLMRMHASSKASALGVGLILLAVALAFPTVEIVTRAIATIGFLLFTSPVSAHLLGKASYRTSVVLWEGTHADELKEYVEKGQPNKLK